MQIKRWSKVIEVGMIKNGCGQSGDETLKLTVSEEWADGINWFFAFFATGFYKFRKAKSRFKDFWVVLVKNGHDLLVHEALKS